VVPGKKNLQLFSFFGLKKEMSSRSRSKTPVRKSLTQIAMDKAKANNSSKKSATRKEVILSDEVTKATPKKSLTQIAMDKAKAASAKKPALNSGSPAPKEKRVPASERKPRTKVELQPEPVTKLATPRRKKSQLRSMSPSPVSESTSSKKKKSQLRSVTVSESTPPRSSSKKKMSPTPKKKATQYASIVDPPIPFVQGAIVIAFIVAVLFSFFYMWQNVVIILKLADESKDLENTFT